MVGQAIHTAQDITSGCRDASSTSLLSTLGVRKTQRVCLMVLVVDHTGTFHTLEPNAGLGCCSVGWLRSTCEVEVQNLFGNAKKKA